MDYLLFKSTATPLKLIRLAANLRTTRKQRSNRLISETSNYTCR